MPNNHLRSGRQNSRDVLLHTLPLDALRADAMRDPEIRHYDGIALALRVLDVVIDRLGLADLHRRADAHEEVAEGHRLRFTASGETLSTIARTIEAERQCCRFLRFRITVEPDGGPISPELSGPPGTREFIAALLDS